LSCRTGKRAFNVTNQNKREKSSQNLW
jgi:hypothetical protein